MNRRSLIVILVLLAFFALLTLGLRKDPREIPSPLIGKPAPDFHLPRLDNPGQALGPSELKGKVWLLNVWASWCGACREEHPLLVELSRRRLLPIIGLNYKDETSAAKDWLQTHGDPYSASAMDGDGKVGIDWGVYGVPETFVIDRQGVIRHKQIGPLTPEVLENTLLPLIAELSK